MVLGAGFRALRPGSIRLAQQQQVSQMKRVAITRSAGFGRDHSRSEPGRFYGIIGRSTASRRFGVPTLRRHDAQASDPSG